MRGRKSTMRKEKAARDFPRKPPPPTGGFAQDGGLSGGADNLCLHTMDNRLDLNENTPYYWQSANLVRIIIKVTSSKP